MSDNNIPKGCKPFDLQKAMAGEPVVTRDGRPYKFGAYNPDIEYSIVGWVKSLHFKPNITVVSHDDKGKFISNSEKPHYNDLFMAAKTQKVWVNLYSLINDGYASSIHDSNGAADIESTKIYPHRTFLKTIETEVEL